MDGEPCKLLTVPGVLCEVSAGAEGTDTWPSVGLLHVGAIPYRCGYLMLNLVLCGKEPHLASVTAWRESAAQPSS